MSHSILPPSYNPSRVDSGQRPLKLFFEEDIDPGKPYQKDKIHTDGGPSDYYDFPESWTTFNDFIEYKSEAQWGKFSFHLGNIGKALCRWGDKDGTSIEYDAKKIIYSGVRILKMIVGAAKTREYLQRLLDDPQFKEK